RQGEEVVLSRGREPISGGDELDGDHRRWGYPPSRDEEDELSDSCSCPALARPSRQRRTRARCPWRLDGTHCLLAVFLAQAREALQDARDELRAALHLVATIEHGHVLVDGRLAQAESAGHLLLAVAFQQACERLAKPWRQLHYLGLGRAHEGA